MSSARLRPLAILRPVLLAGLALAMVAGCGVGQNTQMSRQEAAVNGGNGDAGTIAVRNAALAYPDGDEHFYPTGSDAELVATIANTGRDDDELISASTPAATSVEIEGQRGLPAQRTLRAVAADGDTKNAKAGLANSEIRITLKDFAEDVKPGRTIQLTLLFRMAGEVTIDVPIAAPDEGRAESDH